MPISAKAVLEKHGSGTASSFLKGTDLAKSERSIVVKCLQVREPGAGFLSPLIMDIAPIGEKTAIPLNKTNIKRLAELIQDDDLSKLEGKFIRFEKVLVNNPKTNQMTYGLLATEVRQKK